MFFLIFALKHRSWVNVEPSHCFRAKIINNITILHFIPLGILNSITRSFLRKQKFLHWLEYTDGQTGLKNVCFKRLWFIV